MPYPVDCLTPDVKNGDRKAAEVSEYLDGRGLVATGKCEPFGGQVARIRIDVYGESAAEVESTLLAFGTRCDAASQASSVVYGECVIERNLEETWGATYSWRGRMILHPTIGELPSSERAAAAVETAVSVRPR